MKRKTTSDTYSKEAKHASKESASSEKKWRKKYDHLQESKLYPIRDHDLSAELTTDDPQAPYGEGSSNNKGEK